MIEFKNTRPFEKQFDRLRKKHHSLTQDLKKLKESLQVNPHQGADLGNGLRKVRMAIRSQGKGKSGGARIITYVDAITTELDGTLTFLYIYDKSERSSITDSELKLLLEAMEL